MEDHEVSAGVHRACVGVHTNVLAGVCINVLAGVCINVLVVFCINVLVGSY